MEAWYPFSGIKTTSNPTWLRPKTRAPKHDAEAFARVWLEMVRSMAADLEAAEADAAPTPETFPDELARMLHRIRKHPSKASSNYYYKTYAQYFSDAMAAVAELRRILKPGAAAVLVVQTSYYKAIYVDLPELYVAMGRALDMGAAIAAEHDVSRFLAQINSRSTAHRKSTSHREAVVVLEARHLARVPASTSSSTVCSGFRRTSTFEAFTQVSLTVPTSS